MRESHRIAGIVSVLMAMLAAPSSEATYSIIAVDHETRELAFGAVTCLESADLIVLLPVLRVETGIGLVQGFGDLKGIRRPVIFDALAKGTPPADILLELERFPFHDGMQYAILDTTGATANVTGPLLDAWAGEVVGTVGSITYAIQGNALTGACVAEDMQAAFVAADGDMPARLLAAMIAGRDAGGDGRCSCSLGDPTGCGCPPGVFTKSGHTGAMLVSRPGDLDSPTCNGSGCAAGDYFMVLNVASQGIGMPDPVIQLEGLYAEWRGTQAGLPDAVHSEVSFVPPVIPPNGAAQTTMRIQLRDWAGDPSGVTLRSVSIEHAPGSAGLSTIGVASDLGGGVIEVPLSSGLTPGVDRFRVVVDDGVRPVTLTPDAGLIYPVLGDVDADGLIGFLDLLRVLVDWGPCVDGPESCLTDFDVSGAVGVEDLLRVLSAWGRTE